MTHHTHLVQTRLPIEENVAARGIISMPQKIFSRLNSLSVFQMAFYNPAVLQERVRSLVVP